LFANPVCLFVQRFLQGAIIHNSPPNKTLKGIIAKKPQKMIKGILLYKFGNIIGSSVSPTAAKRRASRTRRPRLAPLKQFHRAVYRTNTNAYTSSNNPLEPVGRGNVQTSHTNGKPREDERDNLASWDLIRTIHIRMCESQSHKSVS
jgi:hypothetical protein